MPDVRVFHSALSILHSTLNWSPRLVSRQVLADGHTPPLQGGANLPQLLGAS